VGGVGSVSQSVFTAKISVAIELRFTQAAFIECGFNFILVSSSVSENLRRIKQSVLLANLILQRLQLALDLPHIDGLVEIRIHTVDHALLMDIRERRPVVATNDLVKRNVLILRLPKHLALVNRALLFLHRHFRHFAGAVPRRNDRLNVQLLVLID
jgi:hypothetical protein